MVSERRIVSRFSMDMGKGILLLSVGTNLSAVIVIRLQQVMVAFVQIFVFLYHTCFWCKLLEGQWSIQNFYLHILCKDGLPLPWQSLYKMVLHYQFNFFYVG